MKFLLCLALFIGFQDPTPIPKLIETLGDSDLERREAAAGKLRACIKEALPQLRKASTESPDPQIRAAATSLVLPVSAGAVLWKHECPHGGELIKPLEIVGRTGDLVLVECGCIGGPLVALAISTGEKKWESRAGDGYATYFSFFPKDGLAFATVNTGKDQVVAIDLATGVGLWTLEGTKGLHRPVVSGDRVFVGGGDGIRAVDRKTGEVRWHFPATNWLSTPAVGDKVVVGVGHDTKVRAIERETGKPAWEFVASGKLSAVAVSGGVAYFGDQGHFYAVDLASGRKVWQCDVTGFGMDQPQVVDRTVYHISYHRVEAEGGGSTLRARYYAVEAATGKVLADRATPCLPATQHRWKPDKEEWQAIDAESGGKLAPEKPCAIAGCKGVHRLAARKIRVGEDELSLFVAPDGRLLTGEAPDDLPGPRLFAMVGGFPVYSGKRYIGPRRSAIACVRAVDLDRE